MKNNLFLTILISALSGYAGSWLFQWQNAPSPAENTLQIEQITNTAEQVTTSIPANYEPPVSTSKGSSSLTDISFVDAATSSRSSVVYIKSIATSSYQRHTWFDLFFDRQRSQKAVTGSGSGVIFSKDGYIVTNNHVIEGADKIEVVHAKRTFPAQLIGTDPSTDLALLKVEATDLPVISIATSRSLNVGDWVLAVGNPFNLESTVTAGIVSAKGRRINILEDIFPIESFIQTDAAINPGNSGGALVNKTGELVGINTAILSQTGSYAGYGFAVPSDIVVKVVGDLKEFGEVQKTFIGGSVKELSEKISDRLQIDNLNGVVITQLDPEGAAQKAGLQAGDVIVKIDQFTIRSKSDFDEKLSYHRPGDEVTVQYERNGKPQTTALQLTNIEGTTDVIRRVSYYAKNLGALFEDVPKMERIRIGINNGVRIKEINRGLIRQMGLPEGFIIVAINNYPVETPEELADILDRIRGRVIVRGITKEGRERYFPFIFN